METNTKIGIKLFIRNNPATATGLKRGSKTFDEAIRAMSTETKINEIFLVQNIDRIRNWID